MGMSTTTPGLRPAARIASGDDGTRYDKVAICLHWATAILVIVQFALAVSWGAFDKPTKQQMVVAHMSFGILLAAVIVARIVWRLVPGHQVDAAVSGRVELASKAVHYLLYAMLVAETILGFVARWSEGRAMSFFGLLIQPPFAPFAKAAHHLIEEIHEWNGWAIVILASGHAMAALYHHYVLRDRVLSRMLPAAVRRASFDRER